MALHVDIVRNEWLAGYQHVVARVFLGDGQLEFESPDPETWREIVFREIDGIDPNEHPDEFLAALPQHIHGTYLFATEPHEDPACPFASRPLVPIETVSSDAPVAA
jgi:hypothetical protein